MYYLPHDEEYNRANTFRAVKILQFYFARLQASKRLNTEQKYKCRN